MTLLTQRKPIYTRRRDPGNGRVTITRREGNQAFHIAEVYDPKDAEPIVNALNGVNIILDMSLGQIREIYADADLPQVNVYVVDFDPLGREKLDFGFRHKKKMERSAVTLIRPIIDRIAEHFAPAAFLTAFRRKLIRRPPPGQLYNRRHAPQA